MNTATVFLGKHLTDEEYGDDAVRQRALEEAIQAIQQNIDGIRIVNRNRLFCSMTVAASARSMAQLGAFLARSGLGHIDAGADRAAIKAAGRR